MHLGRIPRHGEIRHDGQQEAQTNTILLKRATTDGNIFIGSKTITALDPWGAAASQNPLRPQTSSPRSLPVGIFPARAGKIQAGGAPGGRKLGAAGVWGAAPPHGSGASPAF